MWTVTSYKHAITTGYKSHKYWLSLHHFCPAQFHTNFIELSVQLLNQRNLNVFWQTDNFLFAMLFSLKLQLYVQIAWICGICMYKIAILQYFAVFWSWKFCQVLLVINIFFWNFWIISYIFFSTLVNVVNGNNLLLFKPTWIAFCSWIKMPL